MSTAPRRGAIAARDEHIYALPLADAELFAEKVSQHLALDPYYAVVDPARPKRYVTTLYFDSETHEIAEACAHGERNIKLRAREYYAPSGASRIYRGPQLWLEIKTRDGVQTDKVRCKIPARELGLLLQDQGILTREAIASRRGQWGPDGEAVLNEILALFDDTRGPLYPDSIAHYRRRAWQDPRGETRITLDTELAVYRPPPQLLQGMYASLIQVVSQQEPLFEIQEAIVELKLRGPTPEWLTELFPRQVHERSAFSKFLFASRIVAS